MSLHINEALLLMVERRASDLHIDGRRAADDPRPRPSSADRGLPGPERRRTPARSSTRSSTTTSASGSRTTSSSTSPTRSPGAAASASTPTSSAARVGAAFRLIPPRSCRSRSSACRPCVARVRRKPRGLVLVTGPTGSGKSTTLAAMINEINETRDEHIMTIEDPIEFLHAHKSCIVNQRELGADAPSFALGAEGRAAPGPRRDPRRRDARHGDDRRPR